jgi:hypothetical protein
MPAKYIGACVQSAYLQYRTLKEGLWKYQIVKALRWTT